MACPLRPRPALLSLSRFDDYKDNRKRRPQDKTERPHTFSSQQPRAPIGYKQSDPKGETAITIGVSQSLMTVAKFAVIYSFRFITHFWVSDWLEDMGVTNSLDKEIDDYFQLKPRLGINQVFSIYLLLVPLLVGPLW